MTHTATSTHQATKSHAGSKHDAEPRRHTAPAHHAAAPVHHGSRAHEAAATRTSTPTHPAQSPHAADAAQAASFAALGLSPALLRAIAEEGYASPTPIQAQAIRPIMDGRDLLGCAQTGTGKTAAFALPIMHRLAALPLDKSRRATPLPRVLVLSPTRELATQIGDSFATYGRHGHLAHAVVFGGVSQFHQVKALQRGIDILVATPGRLLDLMEQRHADLSEIAIFVLDEADRMLDMGFINPIRRIAAALPHGTKRQTLLFSATMPKEIMHLAESLLHNPVRVAVKPVAATTALIEQSVYMVPKLKKPALLRHLLADPAIGRALVFTRTKHGADRLSRQLNHAGIACDAIHGNKAQNQRKKALEGFRNGRARVLVATDVAARGLDVDGITHVVNFDLPHEPESYVHRIGRTGRAGAAGVAIAFCDHDERDLLRDIERLLGKPVPAAPKLPALPDADPPARRHAPSGHGRSSHGRTDAHGANPQTHASTQAAQGHVPGRTGHGAPPRDGAHRDHWSGETGAAHTPRGGSHSGRFGPKSARAGRRGRRGRSASSKSRW